MNTFLTSWKSSLFGIGAGALNLLANGNNWKQVAFSAAISALGLFAKDGNVTGGPGK